MLGIDSWFVAIDWQNTLDLLIPDATMRPSILWALTFSSTLFNAMSSDLLTTPDPRLISTTQSQDKGICSTHQMSPSMTELQSLLIGKRESERSQKNA